VFPLPGFAKLDAEQWLCKSDPRPWTASR